MNKDLISIIMPSYNTGKYISESIMSVQNQTYREWELLIVDDCSTDDTDRVVAKFLSDKRIRYIKNNKNSGAAISRNKALSCAKGRWIAFLDSDDLWTPDKLEKQLDFMKKNNYDFSYTYYEEIDENSNEKGVLITGPQKINKRKMNNYCWIGCLTVMYNKDIVGNIQIKDIKKNNDYAMWLKVIKKSDCYLLPENLAKYRKRQGSISNHGYTKLIKWHYKLFKDAEEMNVVRSIIFTIRNLIFGFVKKIKYKHTYIK